MPMTPHQRHMAAVKAAATKRRNAGLPPRQPRQTWQTQQAPYNPPTQAAPPPPRPTPTPAPAPPPPSNGRAFAPLPDVRSLRLHVLAAVEDLFVVQTATTGITPDARAAFADYKKLLAHGLGPVNAQASAAQNAGTQNEQVNALRLALIKLIKLTF